MRTLSELADTIDEALDKEDASELLAVATEVTPQEWALIARTLRLKAIGEHHG